MEPKNIKVTDFVQFILKHMTAEQALTKLLASQLTHYEKLKIDKQPADNPENVSPYFIMVAAAMDMGWQIAIEEDHEIIRGLSMGSEDYLKDLFKHGKDDKTESETKVETPAQQDEAVDKGSPSSEGTSK